MGTVVSLSIERDKLIAKKYVQDWLQYGSPTAVMRMNAQFTDRIKDLIRLEFKKQGIDW